MGAAGGLDDEEDDEEDDDEAAGADFLAAAASASRELVRGAVGGFMRTLWALGGMLAVGMMFLCGLIFFLDGEGEGEMYVRALGGEMGGGVYGFSITTCSAGQRIFSQVIKIAGCGDM